MGWAQGNDPVNLLDPLGLMGADDVECPCEDLNNLIKGLQSAKDVLDDLLDNDIISDQDQLFDKLDKRGIKQVGEGNGLYNGGLTGNASGLSQGQKNMITFFEGRDWLGPMKPGFTPFPTPIGFFDNKSQYAHDWGRSESERMGKVIAELLRQKKERGCP